jgi:hypothetical protein
MLAAVSACVWPHQKRRAITSACLDDGIWKFADIRCIAETTERRGGSPGPERAPARPGALLGPPRLLRRSAAGFFRFAIRNPMKAGYQVLNTTVPAPRFADHCVQTLLSPI